MNACECLFLGYEVFIKTLCNSQARCHNFKSSTARENGHHFTGDIFKCISMNEKFCILILISLKSVLRDPIDKKIALVQAKAWRRKCDKPLPEVMLVQFTDAYMRH